MEINRDLPIKKCEEDLLNRGSFAEALAKVLGLHSTNESVVVGIFGGWGTGKTSIINMIIEKMEKILKTNQSNIVMRFSPWNYSSQEDLVNLFFKELSLYIGKSKDKKSKEIIKWLSEYMEVLECEVFENSKVVKLLTSIRKMCSSKNQTLEDVKKNLIQELNKYDKKIIVIIDDIDRLTNSQVLDIFQLVKQIGDLPNIIYFLSMDREMVINALDKKHVGDGEKYLEKIIQIPFLIPEVDKESIRNILDKKVQAIIDTYSDKGESWDLDYKQSIYYNCISLYVKNLRDVNRILNIFNFRYNLFKGEICIEDILAMSIIEVLDPRLFKWIYLNKSILCMRDDDKRNLGEYRDSKSAEFKSRQIEADRALKSVAVLFPFFAVRIMPMVFNEDTWGQERAKMRISNLDRFEMYFSFEVEGLPIKHDKVMNFLLNYSYKEMYRYIQEDCTDLEYLIFEVQDRIKFVDIERGFVIVTVFINSGNRFYKRYNNRGADLLMTLKYGLEDILSHLSTLGPEKDLLLKLVRDIDKDYIGLFTSIVLGSPLRTHQVIKVELNKRIEEIFQKDFSFQSIYSASALIFWRENTPDSYQTFVNRILEDDVQTLKFICAFSSKWRSSNQESGWGFYPKNFENFISINEVLKKIDEIRFNPKFEEFSYEEQLKLATFYLLYNNDDYKQHVSENDAKQLLTKWDDDVFKSGISS